MTFELNPLQLRMFAALIEGASPCGVQGGWGSGKSFGLVFAAKAAALTRPGTSSLIVSDTGPRLGAVIQPVCEDLLGKDGWTWHGDQAKRYWEAPNGSRIWLRAYFRSSTRRADQNPLEGINATFVGVDECQVWSNDEVLKVLVGRTRKAGFRPFMLFTGLPVAGAWWVEAAEKAPGGVALRSASFVNRANLAPEFFENARQHLSEDEYNALILGKPAPPRGQVYSEWRAEAYPDGNLTPPGWRYNPETMTGRLAGDWGLLKPHVLIIVHDPDLDADVLVAEVSPKEVTVQQLAGRVLDVAWPAAHRAEALGPRYWLHAGSGDKAGRTRSDQTLQSTFRTLAMVPPDGLGVVLRHTTDPIRCDIRNGVQRVKRRIHDRGKRSFLCTPEVWNAGLRASGNSFAKSIQSYRYPDGGSDEPIKDGREDPMDAWRYDAINFHWYDSPLDGRTAHAATAPDTSTRRAASAIVTPSRWTKGAR